MKKTLFLRANCFVRVKVKNSRHSCRRKHRPHCRPKHLASCDRVCGIIFQPCNGDRQTYFTSLVPTGAAVARIQNDSACEMRVIIETRCRAFVQTIGQGQQVSVAVPSLLRLSIECGECGGDGPSCRGQYEIQWRSKLESR